MVEERRLVGIDLGIAANHSVSVLDEGGNQVCRRRCSTSLQSLEEVERAALEGASMDTRLEVVLEPTGPAWLPVAVFFDGRGHTIYRPSTARTSNVRRAICGHAKSNRVDAEALARVPLVVPASKLHRLELPGRAQAALDRRVRVTHRLTQLASDQVRRLEDLVRHLLPQSPLKGDLGKADLAVLEETGGDPRRLRQLGSRRLTQLIHRESRGQLGSARAQQWLEAAEVAVEVMGDHPAVPYDDLAEEVRTEVRLLRATQAELALHEKAREERFAELDRESRQSDEQPGLGELVRSLPGLARVGGPVVLALTGRPDRFSAIPRYVSFTGLVAKASETGDSDRKGQPMSKAGPQLLRTTFFLAADTARKQDPQLARIYYVQMVERGACHEKALAVVAAHLARRTLAVLKRGTPYLLRDIDGRPLTEQEAKAIVAERYQVPEEVRRRRRSRKWRGKAPQQVSSRHAHNGASRGATRQPSPSPIVPRSRPKTPGLNATQERA